MTLSTNNIEYKGSGIDGSKQLRHEGRKKMAYQEINNVGNNYCLFYACEVARTMYDQQEIERAKEKNLGIDLNFKDKKTYAAFLINEEEQKKSARLLMNKTKILESHDNYGIEELIKVKIKFSKKLIYYLNITNKIYVIYM